MSASPRSVPPEIPGFVDGRPLGSGGFAEVFLYRQLVPEHEVAIKVLGERLGGDDDRRQFLAEANLMAAVAKHPYVLNIFGYNVTADGRPYIVMEYCSGSDLAKRVRQQPLPVAEALRTGIRMAGAVETAHRLGILHRDIKPANILVTDFGNPVLTDFGIAASVQDAGGVEGLSVPWAPPEVLEDPSRSTVQSDVYSLAATVWHLLAGHSPFVVPGGQNAVPDLVRRITGDRPPRTGRGDVPVRLERLLERAMSKDPAMRPVTALQFARDLQAIESEEGYAETSVDVMPVGRRPTPPAGAPEVPHRGPEADALPTTGPRTAPSTAPARSPLVPPALAPPVAPVPPVRVPVPSAVDERTRGRDVPSAPPVDDTRQRPELPLPPAVVEPAPRSRPLAPLLLGLAALLVVAGLVVVLVLPSGGEDDEPVGPTTAPTPTAPAAVVPAPEQLAGARQPDGSVLFTWVSPEPAEGDQWLVRRVDPDVADQPQRVGEPAFSAVDVPQGRQACVEVSVVRADGRASVTPAEACAG